MRISLVVVFVLLFISCNNKAKKEERQKDLNALEIKKAEFFSNVREMNEKYDYGMAMELGDTIQILIDKYEGDTIVPNLYFDLANLYINHLGDVKKGISIFLKVREEFPDHWLVPVSVLSVAYIFEEKLNKPKEAEKYYKLLIREFPDHKLAEDARQALTNMHKSAEEIYESFIKKQGQESGEQISDSDTDSISE